MITRLITRIAILCVLLALPAAVLLAQDEDQKPAEGSADTDSQYESSWSEQETTEGAAQEGEAATEGEAAADEAADAKPAEKKSSGCINCHLQIGGEMTQLVEQFQSSVHSEMDFSCTDCHGGNPDTDDIFEAKSEESGFIGKPDRSTIPELCARCHSDPEFMRPYGNIRTDQLELYKTSKHGIALYENGDTNVATCVDCHTAHNILKVNNPNASVYKKNQPETCGRCHSNASLMGSYGVDTEIPTLYKSSQHGIQLLENNDMGAPACSNCHGSHGAAPPGVTTIENVCGTCHLATEKYFNQSRHSTAFKEYGLGQCVACHNPHKLPKPTDNFLSEDAEPNCLACHSSDSEQFAMITRMRESITGIQDLHEEALKLVEETEHTTHMSMYDMTPQIELINTKMLSARAMTHATDPQAMEENLQGAKDTFGVIQAFTVRLLERARVNKMIVAILALVLVGFGLFMFVYRRMVLDVSTPWETYRGETVEDKPGSGT